MTTNSVDPRDHIGLAKHIARKFWHHGTWRGIELADVEQEAVLALYECAPRYDRENGAKFSTFAGRSIECRLILLRARNRRMVSYGTRYRHSVLYKRLHHYRGEVTPAAVMAVMAGVQSFLGLDEMEAHRAVGWAQGHDVFFDDMWMPQGRDPHEVIADEDDEVTERECATHEYAPVVARILEECACALGHKGDPNPIVRAIMARRIMAEEPETLLEIGVSYGLSRERIRQLEARLLGVVRGKLERAGLLNPESGKSVR